MTNPIAKIKKLQNIQGTKAKQQFIADNQHDEQFMFLLKVLLDPFVITNIRSITFTMPKEKVYKNKFEEFKNLIKFLEHSTRSKKTVETVKQFLESCSQIEAEVYHGIVTKSLKLGISIKGVNKALGFQFIKSFELMKAEPYVGQNIEFPCIVQEKLDGVRCAVIVDGTSIKAFTYNGQQLILPSIFSAIKTLQEKIGFHSMVFDGELIANSKLKTSALVNRILKNDSTPEEEKNLQFHIFDMLSTQEFYTKTSSTPLQIRLERLEKFMQHNKSSKIMCVPSYICNDFEAVKKIFNDIKKEGKEGIMIKNINSPYEFKRSKHWIKMKSIYSTTLKIIDIYLGSGKYKNKLGGIICKTEDELLTVKVGSGFTDEQRETFLKYPIIGLHAEIIFTDINVDENGNLFLEFPRFKEIRLDKSAADTLEQVLNEIPSGRKSLLNL